MLTVKVRPADKRQLQHEAAQRGVTVSHVVRERLGVSQPLTSPQVGPAVATP